VSVSESRNTPLTVGSVLAAVLALSGCGSENTEGAPAGVERGEIEYDCSINCGDDTARDRLGFGEIWCEWKADHVVVHVRVENPLVTPTETRITPAYEIKDGGRHGTSFGSDRRVPVAPFSFTEAEIDAGSPEGVPAGTEIASCAPQVQSMDIVDSTEVESSGDVTIVTRGRLD
jgi:hypothetical protein